MPRHHAPAQSRATLAAIGILAGAALWAFTEIADRVENDRLFLAMVTLAAVLFPVWLVLTGPQGATRAGNAALAIAAPSAALIWWASLRFDTVDAFLRTGLHPAALFGAVVILTAFAAVWLQDRRHWHSYPLLFEASWRICVRALGAALFTGLVWMLVLLSDAVLEIVGLTIVGDVIEIAPVPYVLTGGVLGLALSVLHEFRDRVSPFVLLRLLRLLVPVVLVVAGLFAMALGVRGFASLPGGLSPAATLLAMCVAGITLVTVALDRTPEDEVSAPQLRRATRLLALLLPVLAVAAALAVWQRVAAYGWTPERLAAALAAGWVLAYAAAFAAMAARGGPWMARIRAANVPLALGLAGIGLLWLTPILDAEKISARSQAARILSGQTPVESAPVWELTREWGRVGRAEAERLRAAEFPGRADLSARLDEAAARDTRGAFDMAGDRAVRAARAQWLAERLPVLPAGETVPAEAWARLDRFSLDRVIEGCDRALPDGRPGCLLIIAPFDPSRRERQGLLFYRTGTGLATGDSVIELQGRMALTHGVRDLVRRHQAQLTPEELMRLANGGFAVAPSDRNVLRLDDRVFAPAP